MKIIFESEEEKKRFVESMSNSEICPTTMFLEEIEDCAGDRSCSKCWMYATNGSNVSIEDQAAQKLNEECAFNKGYMQACEDFDRRMRWAIIQEDLRFRR